MRATKDLLLKLQKLDDEIDALRAEEESIPEKKQQLQEELGATSEKVTRAKEESIELAKQRKGQEIELESADAKKSKFQSQLFQVKSNREYEALQHEIAALDETKSRLEDTILETLERTEEVNRVITEYEKRLSQEQEKVAAEEKRLDAKLAELTERIEVKNDERERLVVDLDEMLLKRYERIRGSKGGLAVTSVENGACGGCFRRIPPHEMQNLKRDDRIITCEQCGRIIIWRWE
jgi:predicted  nucleic acid-binding Zn-ribbon protein